MAGAEPESRFRCTSSIFLVLFPVQLSKSLKSIFAKKTPNHAEKFSVFTSISPAFM
ncbi:hypothetical protein A671_04432 [Salmonella enterica subsp. enterica serovar Dublin str. DG22]|uniref:Uncharacterized protein n=1 Tax=Salmonella enterica subsp. enterica serovar Dublin str. UC16 TaxID=1192688 RepID=M7RRS7_SALDU|nr:hypothetical protein A670_00257 [Salmonella enterica subsp. enterica serovar Dublin str. UC16]EPI65133.1 hypothetical protein A671_04432 [Salmonella enterica subsp. enterica serovar Dublin str. DG22]EPI93677.1 hypothetical protein A678_04668 [Salmonella enterica subsp. enterica serovar Enteritidis str. 2010K-0271]EPI95759.1 hypothetical protein A677_04230 [Salmonella enterica subsp. enterica serovar Enteritidis str. 2010K-0267]